MTPIKINNRIYYAEDLIGLTLFAARTLPIMRLPFDSSEPIRTVTAGNPVGKIHSFVNPTAGRSNAWFQFYDNYGQLYHAEILPGRFSLDELNQQIADNQPQPDTIDRVQNLVMGGLVVWGVTKFITALIKK